MAYFIVNFTDGQQLKLIPVTAGGHRYIAWMAPLSMAIQYVVAHLGSPYADDGQIAVAAPFEQPGQPPVFGLWQDGQGAPPTDAEVIGHGTTGGHAWKVTAYEGPWGTCFVTDPYGTDCVPATGSSTTTILGAVGAAVPADCGLRLGRARGGARCGSRCRTARPSRRGRSASGTRTCSRSRPARESPRPGWTAYDASGATSAVVRRLASVAPVSTR